MINGKNTLAIQWHITEKCMLNCKHCYLGDKAPIEMDYHNFKIILNNIKEFGEKNDYNFEFYLTGGDPLLHSDFEKICALLHKNNISFSLLCNPDTVFKTNIDKLKQYEIKSIQFSIDGNEKHHDWMRGTGNFKHLERAIALVKKAGINVALMFTIYTFNALDLEFVMRFADKMGVNKFSFDLGISIGNANENHLMMVEEDNLEDILKNYLLLKNTINQHNPTLFFEEKCNLINKLHILKKDFGLPKKNDPVIYDGCQIGISSFVIDVYGDVLGCRRLSNSKCGNLLTESLSSIWYYSPVLRYHRRKIFLKETCKICIYKNWCQGCEAYEMAQYAQNGHKRKTICGKTMDNFGTFLDEKEYLNKILLLNNRKTYVNSNEFKKLYVRLLFDENLKYSLLKNYSTFSKENKIGLNESKILYWFFSEKIKE